MSEWIPFTDATWISDDDIAGYMGILQLICHRNWFINTNSEASYAAALLKCSHGFTFIANHIDVQNIHILHTTYRELKKQYANKNS